MRFTLPVQDASEVLFLKRHGADELYCGYLDDEWRAKFGGDASVSRRQGAANIGSSDALERLCNEAKKYDIPVHLTLNARVTEGQVPYLIKIAEQWADMGGSGIILQDPVLLMKLRHLHQILFTASLMTVTVNRYGAAFWRDLGAGRIVLPRVLKIQEMKLITDAVPEVDYEAMVMGDRCPFIDGLCRSVHAESHSPADKDAVPAERGKSYNPSGKDYHLCWEYDEIHTDPCAACRLKEMEESGISVGKTGGRGLPLEIRLQWLDHLQYARSRDEKEKIPLHYRECFGHECSCYYPDGEEA